MKNSKIKFFSVILFLLCLFQFKEMNTSAISNVKEEEENRAAWNKLTYEKIINSQNNDGSVYTLNDERSPSFYDTFFNLKLLESINHPFPNKNETSRFIEKWFIDSDIKVNNLQDILQLYYATGIAKVLNIDLQPYSVGIQNKIMLLRTDDGFFTIQEKNDMLTKIIASEHCIKILNNLNIPYHDDEIYNNINRIILNKQYEDITTYKWSIINSLISVQNIIKNTNFFLSNDGALIKAELLQEGKSVLGSPPKNEMELLYHKSAYQFITQMDGDINLSNQYVDYLNNFIHEDSGFNVISTEYSDPQMTMEIWNMYPLSQRPDPVNFINKIRTHQLGSGFFASQNPTENISFSRNYMAMKIILDLDKTVPESIIKFINSNKINDVISKSPKELYYLNLSRELLQIPKLEFNNTDEVSNDPYSLINYCSQEQFNLNKQQIKTKIEDLAKNILIEKPSSFKTLELLTKLNLDCKIGATIPINTDYFLQYFSEKDGAYSRQENANLKDTYYVVSVMKNLKLPIVNKERMIKFINMHRVPSGGFSNNINSKTSNLEYTFFGIEALRMLSNQ